MIERIVIVVLTLSLVGLGVKSWETEKKLDGERMFWRTLYRAAEKDAQWKRCLELDETHVICEKE